MEVGYLPVDMTGTNYVKLGWFPGYIQNKHDKHLFSHSTHLKVPPTESHKNSPLASPPYSPNKILQ